MFQTIRNQVFYVVDLPVVPDEPFTDGGDPALTQYAEALTAAIQEGVVDQPGKYAIAVNPKVCRWNIYRVKE